MHEISSTFCHLNCMHQRYEIKALNYKYFSRHLNCIKNTKKHENKNTFRHLNCIKDTFLLYGGCLDMECGNTSAYHFPAKKGC